MVNEFFLLTPEIVLVAMAVVIPFVSETPRFRLRGILATGGLTAGFLTTLWMLWEHPAYGFFAQTGLGGDRVVLGAIEVTVFALFFKLLFVGLALLVCILSGDLMSTRRETGEYYSLLLIATVGMMVVAGARDLMTLFVGLEMTALSSYTLVGYRRRSQQGTEAATKFFIIGALSAALTLYGISLLYAITGSVRFDELAVQVGALSGARPVLLLAVVFLIAGFGFKVTTVPFHMWAPDVLQAAPTPISAFLSGVSKKMGFAAFFKVFLVALFALRMDWGILVGILSVLTMTVGNLAALQQTSLKRLLAWSSVAQAGYILIALVIAGSAESESARIFALTGGLFHVLTHGVMMVGAFLLVAVLAFRGVGDTIDDYRGLFRRYPLAGLTLTTIMLSLVGIPPLAGFASKFVLFGGAIQAGVAEDNNWFLFLAVAGILNSALSVVYYARVIRVVYLDELAPEESPARLGVPASADAVIAVVLALTILMGVWAAPWIDLSRDAAESLFASVRP